MGTVKRWECWWLMTNLKRKRMKETSLIEHLPYMVGTVVDPFLTLLVMQVLSPFDSGVNKPREGDFPYSSNMFLEYKDD